MLAGRLTAQPGTCRAGSHNDWEPGATLSHFLDEDALCPPQPSPLPASSWPGEPPDKGLVMSLLLFPEPSLDFFFFLMFKNSPQRGRCPAAG